MAAITAKDVQDFRKRTGLPLMDCKKALTEADGDADKAVELLRKRGEQLADKRADRETAFGRFGMHFGDSVGAMVELKCESAPVASNEEFVQLASDLATQLATGPGAKDAEELLSQDSPSKPGTTLGEQKDELFNRIREVFNVGRLQRIDSRCGGYEHPGAAVHGVMVEADGGADDQVRDIAMHIAAMNPAALSAEDIDPAEIEKEREIRRAAAIAEGKPENIADKVVEGQLKKFASEKALLEQPYVKAEAKESVGEFAEANGITVKGFTHWVLGES